mmetsp:Transcript_167915/g.539337  ORF Transcript_167915/g.539337 Transcript_167915/m.539337 type:complete len:215 (+) Transcript_167915:578-1222(+)
MNSMSMTQTSLPRGHRGFAKGMYFGQVCHKQGREPSSRSLKEMQCPCRTLAKSPSNRAQSCPSKGILVVAIGTVVLAFDISLTTIGEICRPLRNGPANLAELREIVSDGLVGVIASGYQNQKMFAWVVRRDRVRLAAVNDHHPRADVASILRENPILGVCLLNLEGRRIEFEQSPTIAFIGKLPIAPRSVVQQSEVKIQVAGERLTRAVTISVF